MHCAIVSPKGIVKFKQKVVSEIESGIYTISQAQQLYRIGSNSTIRNSQKSSTRPTGLRRRR